MIPGLLHFSSINLATPAPPLGMMELVTSQQLEETGKIGVGAVEDLTQRQLLMLDACVSCGRCEEACPAFAVGKPLSPKKIVQDVRGYLNQVGPLMLNQSGSGDDDDSLGPKLHGEAIAADLMRKLEISAADLIDCAYIDLLHAEKLQ